MKLKYKWIFTLLIAFFLQFSFAQERTITGKVSDLTGPLPGVNVSVKGSPKGVQTDFDGKYAIKAKTGEFLNFSFIGMADKSVKVGSSSSINVILESESKTLEEVVVVAYGTQKSKAIVGSVAVLGKEVLEKQVATSVLTSLQGSVAGVNIIAAGGQPGDNPVIRIRGISSISSEAGPLIILDGAPFNGNLNTISQDQIQSMSVLKDASSTALYGSRGSNGVIVITTKRGKLDTAPKVNFSTMVGFSSNAVDLHKLVGADDYMKYSWEAIRNNNQYVSNQTPATAGLNASNNLISTLGYNPYTATTPVDANGNLVTTNKKWNTDWEDLMLNNAALRTEYTFGVTGGSENTTYSFSTNYLSQEGNVVTSKFDRATTRLSIDSKINNWLTAGITTFYSTSKQNYPTQSGSSFQSAIQWIYTIPSIYPEYRRDVQGNLVKDGLGQNIFDYGATPGQPLNATRPQLQNENAYGSLYNYKIKYKRDNFTANAYLLFNITKDLTFKTNLAYDKYLFDDYNYASNEVGYASSVGGRVTQNRDITTSSNFINTLSYRKTFGKHNIGADLIQEAYKYEIDELGAQGEGFLPGVYVLTGSTTPSNVSGSTTEERISSYLGRATYNYDEKYFIEGSYRKDGSSRYSSETRWGDFYAVGGSWLVSQESFLKDNNTISELKLRASYGELGNNRLTGRFFPYIQQFETGYPELDNAGVVLGEGVDPTIKWEKTASTDYGIDIGLLKNRIFLTVDYYNKESVDLAYRKPLPGSTGNTGVLTNVGSLRNYGWEFSLNTRNIANTNFLWTSSLVFSMDKNEITELSQASFTNGNKKWEVGRSLYEFFVQEWAGVDPATGYGTWYKDVLGTDGKPTGERVTTKTYAEATRYYVDKSSLPDVIGGFTNYFKYKNIDLNILFNFSYGSYVYDSTYASLVDGGKNPGRTMHQDLANRWQKPGDITDVPLLLGGNNDFNGQSTRFLFKNDYIRLKALNIGYNLPKDLVNKMNVSRLRLYLQGDNLWTYQSHEGIDPEQDINGATDSRSYNQRLVSFGINLDF
jgi:TonB-linked SusC/RagA family outer membrane protein